MDENCSFYCTESDKCMEGFWRWCDTVNNFCGWWWWTWWDAEVKFLKKWCCEEENIGLGQCLSHAPVFTYGHCTTLYLQIRSTWHITPILEWLQLTKSKGCILVRNDNTPMCINEAIRSEHIRVSPEVFVHESAIEVADDHCVLQHHASFGCHLTFAFPLENWKYVHILNHAVNSITS